jgi:hypothetical protein
MSNDIRAALAAEPVGEGAQRLLDAAVDARWYTDLRHPATPPAPAPGEVEKLISRLRRMRSFDCARAATLLQQQAVPVPVSERLPGEGDLDLEGTCWVWNFTAYTWGLFRLDPTSHSHWLPAHAIPLPQAGEVKP